LSASVLNATETTVSQQLVSAISGPGLTGIVRLRVLVASGHGAGLAAGLGARHPVLEVPADVHKILYTTNSRGSLNDQLRKII
jgi:hypothetical protein